MSANLEVHRLDQAGNPAEGPHGAGNPGGPQRRRRSSCAPIARTAPVIAPTKSSSASGFTSRPQKIKPQQLISRAVPADPYPALAMLRENYPCYRDWLGQRLLDHPLRRRHVGVRRRRELRDAARSAGSTPVEDLGRDLWAGVAGAVAPSSAHGQPRRARSRSELDRRLRGTRQRRPRHRVRRPVPAGTARARIWICPKPTSPRVRRALPGACSAARTGTRAPKQAGLAAIQRADRLFRADAGRSAAGSRATTSSPRLRGSTCRTARPPPRTWWSRCSKATTKRCTAASPTCGYLLLTHPDQLDHVKRDAARCCRFAWLETLRHSTPGDRGEALSRNTRWSASGGCCPKVR